VNDCILSQFGENGRQDSQDYSVKTLSAKDAKYGFSRLIDLASGALVAVAK